MNGLYFDFEQNDITIDNGSFTSTQIDGQNCALIALSYVCRITEPQVGYGLAAKLQNRKFHSVSGTLSAAKRMVKDDGAKDIVIDFNEDEQLIFNAKYDS